MLSCVADSVLISSGQVVPMLGPLKKLFYYKQMGKSVFSMFEMILIVWLKGITG